MSDVLICALTLLATTLLSAAILIRAETLMTRRQRTAKERAARDLDRAWRSFYALLLRRRWSRLFPASLRVWGAYARWKRVFAIGRIDLFAVRCAGLALLGVVSADLWDVLLKLIDLVEGRWGQLF